MRTSIIVLIAVSIMGISIISIGFLTNQENKVVNTLTSYEKLEKYKKELEKINENNQQILSYLEKQISESDDIHLEQIKKEIEVIRQVINDNKKELEEVIKKLSEMESKP